MTVSDLSPDALARLEMKLMADLEIVRKVRALLEEHRAVLGLEASPAVPRSSTGGATASLPSPAAMPNQPAVPVEPRKSAEEIFTEGLLALPESGFTIKAFKQILQKVADVTLKDSSVKTFLNRMIRKQHVVVLESRVGRGGSLYRCTLPRPEPADDLPDDPVPPADPAHPPAESANQPPATSP